MDNRVPFPQADDFDKIVGLLNIYNEKELNDNKKISILLDDISERQVLYYISAAIFIGIIEIRNGDRVLSNIGEEIRKKNPVLQKAELISLILADQVFLKTYVNTLFFGEQEKEDVANLIKKYYPNYSEAIYLRRAQTVISWINWVNNVIGANT